MCSNIGSQSNKQDLLLLSSLIGVPEETINEWRSLTKAQICQNVSVIISLGRVWNEEAFEARRMKMFQVKLDFLREIEAFKAGLERYANIDTAGKTVTQLLAEFDLKF